MKNLFIEILFYSHCKKLHPNWIHPKTKEKISNLIAKLPEEDRKSILKVKKN